MWVTDSLRFYLQRLFSAFKHTEWPTCLDYTPPSEEKCILKHQVNSWAPAKRRRPENQIPIIQIRNLNIVAQF